MDGMFPIEPDGSLARPAMLSADNEVPVRQWSQWALLWRRFKRHRLALLGARIFLFMLLLALVGPWIAPPFRPAGAAGISYFAAQGHVPQLWPLGLRTLMGTDVFGNAVSSYVLAGARATLVIGLFGSLLAVTVGSVIGGIAGYFGGIVDTFLMRVADALLTVPFLPLIMVLVLYLPNRGQFMYIVLFGVTGWAAVARLVRGSVLSLREREFTEAARALGVSDLGVIGRHLVPNTLDILIVAFTLNIAVFILAEAALDYLGAGPTDMTWGKALAGAGDILELQWWMIAFPGAGLLLTVLAVNFMGDGLRDALDVSASSFMPVGAYGDEEDGIFVRSLVWLVRGAAVGMGQVGRMSAEGRRWARGYIWPPISRAADRGLRVSLVPSHSHPLRVSQAGYRSGRVQALLQGIPIAAILLVLGVAFLYGHSPLRYSPYYDPPVTQANVGGEYEYGAVPAGPGQWSLLYIDGSSHLVYSGPAGSGHDRVQTVVPDASDVGEPSLAMRGSNGLAAWVEGGNEVIQAAFVGRHPSAPFTLNGAGGQVEHPYAVALPNGDYDVFFEWGKAHSPDIYDIYLATIHSGTEHPASLRLIARGTPVAFYPRAVVDGSGALDMIYMNRVVPGKWHWLFQRLTPEGGRLGRSRVLDTVYYYEIMKSGGINAEVYPSRWGADIKRAPDGTVWAAWGGDGTASVAHWGRTGAMILSPRVMIPSGLEGASDVEAVRSLALAVTPDGLTLYHEFPGEEESYLGAIRVSLSGKAEDLEPHRVAYDGGGAARDPHAGIIGDRPAVIWQKVRTDEVVLEGTAYHGARPPDLLTHLGLNIGNLAANIAVVILGSLTLGLGIAAVNLVPILLPVPLRLLAGRILPARQAWTVYALLLAAIYIWLFAASSTPPSFVLFSSSLSPLYGWALAVGAAFTAWWAGYTLFRRWETAFRAAGMALAGFYVPAVMYALLFIEGQLGRI